MSESFCVYYIPSKLSVGMCVVFARTSKTTRYVGGDTVPDNPQSNPDNPINTVCVNFGPNCVILEKKRTV